MSKAKEYFDLQRTLDQLKPEAIDELQVEKKEIESKLLSLGHNSGQKMTKYESLDISVSVLSILVSIVSLISIFYLISQTKLMIQQTDLMNSQTVNMDKQTKQLTDSISFNAFTEISKSEFEFNKLLFENSTFIPFFYYETDIDEKHKDYKKVIALAGMRLDQIATVYDNANFVQGFKGTDGWKAWSTYIKHIFKKSPVMCKNLNENRGFYTDEFVKFVGQECPPLPTSTSTKTYQFQNKPINLRSKGKSKKKSK